MTKSKATEVLLDALKGLGGLFALENLRSGTWGASRLKIPRPEFSTIGAKLRLQGNDLPLAINNLGKELADDPNNHRSSFRVTVEGESRNLHPIVREEIYKIAADALRNAFRHAGAREIEVEIRYDTEQFRLRVRDDGKGIDSAILSSQGSKGHYGLRGMRERAALVGGKLVVWSEADSSTELELRIPASAVYMKNPRSFGWIRKFAAKA